jgi:hypothetical protein
LLAALTVFFEAGCAARAAGTAELETAVDALAPEAPPVPVMEPVAFEDRDGGLWLSYGDYRSLERNIIAPREHAAGLALITGFYREEKQADAGLVFSTTGAAVTLDGVLVGIGVIKGRLADAVETNAEQAKQTEKCAARDGLAAAARRSDEMLAMMRKRADEDRAKSGGRYKEFYALPSRHTERLAVLEPNRQAVTRTLEEIRKDLNGGFKDIREELRELGKQGWHGGERQAGRSGETLCAAVYGLPANRQNAGRKRGNGLPVESGGGGKRRGV